MSDVAGELGAGWDPVMDAVAAFGQALIDDPDRFGDVEALGMDETLRARTGRWKTQRWSTLCRPDSRAFALTRPDGCHP